MRTRTLPFAFVVGVPAFLILAGITSAASAGDQPAAATQPTEKQLAEARAVLRQCLDPLTPEEKQNIEKLITDLESNRWKVRKAASEKLSRLDIRALPIIRRVVESEDPEVSLRAELILKVLRANAKAWADRIDAELNSAIDTFAAAGEREIVLLLIRLLDHDHMEVRYVAEYGLRRITEKNFGYNSYDDPPKRAEAAGEWRQWWRKNEASFTFEKDKAKAGPFGILVCDNEARKLTAVTPAGKVVWSRTFEKPFRCAAGLPDGNVIVGFDGGQVVEYDPDFKQVWHCQCMHRGKLTVTVCDISRLPNGNTLIAQIFGHHGFILEVNRAGKTILSRKHRGHVLSARRLPNGNTLFTESKKKPVFEINRNGKILWKRTCEKFPCDAIRLPNDNILIVEHEGTGGQLVKVDRTGKVIWKRGTLGILTGVCRLPDGTIAVNKRKAAVLVNHNGKPIRQLLKHKGTYGKIHLAPAAVLERKQSAISSQPSDKTKKQH